LDKLLIIISIVITIAILGSFTIPINQKYSPFETWGNNEHFYKSDKEWQVVCDITLVGISSNCQAMNENGEIVPWPTPEEYNIKKIIFVNNLNIKDQETIQ